MRIFTLTLLLGLCLSACTEKEDNGPRFIFLSVDKTTALDQGDQILITASVRDKEQNPLEGFNLEFFANGQVLENNTFSSTTSGEFFLTARYQEIESPPIRVSIVNLEEDVEELVLEYRGNPYLTTNPWSVSGDFDFLGRIADQFFQLPTNDIDLKVNAQSTEQQGGFIFEEAGEYKFQAFFSTFKSNSITLNVRPQKVFETITIPIIFHDYDAGVTNTHLKNFIDTLNRSFSASSLSKARTLNGSIDPNAVNCYIKFVAANEAPPGRKLDNPGLNVIQPENGEYPTLGLPNFQELEQANTWDPTTYVNVWIAPDYDFEFPSIHPNEAGSFGARGLSYSPFIEEGFELPGLATRGVNAKDPDPSTLSHGILLRSGSVLFEHPDYLINRMAYYLGVFDLMTFDCRFEGDYCPDTPNPDLSKPIFPFNEVSKCDGGTFFMTNHMSFGRRYTHFSYDQRERMHFVLEHGLYRPRKN